uniref:Fibronectin type-III domain-containing protein n=1 Tax=Angiostrongylus cantonensis TaxID=6313 RepID=A0A0K0DIN2_ANGCA
MKFGEVRSPNPPELDSIEVGEHEATVSYFSPKEANITYRIEYFPEHHPARVNLVETNATLLLLHSLDSDTVYRITVSTSEDVDDPVLPVEQLVSEFGDPSWIHMRAENHVIRVMWSVPNGALCDAFLVNYTVLSITHPKSYSIATLDEFTLIKFFANHTLDLRVFCMLAGSLSKTWWAHRIACLKSPLSVNGLHVISSETDEFYTAQVSIEWNWPTANNFDLFKIVVSYGIGELQVREVGPVILDKLKPAQQYRIVVRNESIELGLKSKAAELETITPPFISSTLFPGPISSTAININFDGTDLEQGRFDHYELVVIANNSGNITKRIEKQQEWKLFRKLPG